MNQKLTQTQAALLLLLLTSGPIRLIGQQDSPSGASAAEGRHKTRR